MLNVALTNPRIKEHFSDGDAPIVMQEYYEIKESNDIRLIYGHQPVEILSKEEIAMNNIEKYLVVSDITVGPRSTTVSFRAMPQRYKGFLDYFKKVDGVWRLDENLRLNKS